MAIASEEYRDRAYYRRDQYIYAVPELGERPQVTAEHVPRDADGKNNLKFWIGEMPVGAATAHIETTEPNRLLIDDIGTATVENHSYCLEAAVRDIGDSYPELSAIRGPFVTDPRCIDVSEQAATELRDGWSRRYIISGRSAGNPSGLDSYAHNLYIVKKQLSLPGMAAAIEFTR